MGKSHDLATIATDGLPTLEVDTIKNTSGTTGLTIDSSGFIKPKVVAFQAFHDAALTLTNGLESTFQLDTTVIDPAGIVDLANNRIAITAATAGLYWLSFVCRLGSSAPPRQVVYIKVNGAEKLMAEENSGASGSSGSQSVMTSGLLNLVAGDLITYHVYHNHGSNRDIEHYAAASRVEGYRIGTA